MSISDFLKIETGRCIQCLQCLRSCDVNAIRYVDNKLFIHPQRCVKCGKCYENCPNGAIELRNLVPTANIQVKDNPITIASVSPTWVSEFRGVTMNQFVQGLKMLGFTHVSQSTHGAQQVIEKTRDNFKNSKPLVISSLCPVVNRLIETYYPQYLEYMNPVSMPETLHCRMLKKWYGEDAKVIYISSCVASKGNVVLDGTMMYSALKDWLDEEKIDLRALPKHGDNVFEPFLANTYHGYQLVSSAIEYFPQVDVQSASGLNRVMKMLKDINVQDVEDKVYLELFACEGGCLTSVGSIDKNNVLAKKLRFDKHIREGRLLVNNVLPEVEYAITRKDRGVERFAAAKDKEAVLRKMNITESGSLLDCGACGYNTCDEFANAVVMNMAEIRTCVWHQKNELTNNLQKIIEHIPYGFFIVNKDMKFENVNSIFCNAVGVDRNVLLSKKISIEKMVSFTDEIKDLFENGLESKSYEVIINGRDMKLKLYRLVGTNLIFGGVKNFFSSAAFDEAYVESVKKIIQDNVSSVQKIASLLGENISRTETLLSSIVDNKED